jgi:hypothetical protein
LISSGSIPAGSSTADAASTGSPFSAAEGMGPVGSSTDMSAGSSDDAGVSLERSSETVSSSA